MEKNQIFIKSGTEYKKITKELLAESNLAELIADCDKMVGIKPNMVSASDPSRCHDTYGDHCRNPGISEGEWLPQNDDPGRLLGRGSYLRCI